MILLKRLQEIHPPHPLDQSQNVAADRKVKRPLGIFLVMMMICLTQVCNYSKLPFYYMYLTSSRMQVKLKPHAIAQALYSPPTDHLVNSLIDLHTCQPTKGVPANQLTIEQLTDWPTCLPTGLPTAGTKE